MQGICHICGQTKKLSFEHVPPRSAFNNRPILYNTFHDIFNKDPLSIKKGRQSQRGAGSYTLCEKCNNDTGSWYGSSYCDWTYQGMNILSYTKLKPTLYYNFLIFPLRVIKEIICMFFSCNPPEFQRAHTELVKFVLDREQKYLNPEIRIYAFYCVSEYSRSSAVSGRGTLRGDINTFSETTFPPFGYVLSLDSPTIDKRLVDITHFSTYTYNEFKDITLRLPVLPVYTYIPGDYRTKDEIKEIVDKNPSIIK